MISRTKLDEYSRVIHVSLLFKSVNNHVQTLKNDGYNCSILVLFYFTLVFNYLFVCLFKSLLVKSYARLTHWHKII